MPRRSLEHLESLVGESRETVRDLTVEPGKVAEFAAALRDDRRLFRDQEIARAAGYPAIPAPLTFTRIGYFPRHRPEGVGRDLGFDLGFAPERVVHGNQGYQFERPLYVGDVIEGTTTLVDVFQREGSDGDLLTFAVLQTEFRTADGELVLTTENTRIETGGSADGDDGGSGAGEEGPSDGGGPRPDGGRPQGDAEYRVGDAGPTLTVEAVGRKDFVKYAGASGDFNRVHYDDPYARAAGYDAVIGQGMLTAGYASRLATDWFGLGTVRTFSTRFRSPLRPGSSVTVEGTVTDVSEGPKRTVEAELSVSDQQGRVLATSDVTAVVPEG